MFMRIFDPRLGFVTIAALAGCNQAPPDNAARPIACAMRAHDKLAQNCRVERPDGVKGETVLLWRPDGGFHRLQIIAGVAETADGSEQAQVDQGERLTVVILGAERYVVPQRDFSRQAAMIAGPILTVAQMRAAEQALVDTGLDPYTLMQRAGEGAADLIWRIGHQREALVLCGPGNNGGDGYVIARVLRDRGVPVRVAALSEPHAESARRARLDWGGPVEPFDRAKPALQIVDALFGIGLSRALDASIAERLAALVGASQYSFAIDVPSGVESDLAICLSPVPTYGLSLALGAWKPAHILSPTRSLARQSVLVDIGIVAPPGASQMLAPPHISAPQSDDHKYSRGLVAVVSGSMMGAAVLSAEAAARGGAGYVRIVGVQGLTTSRAIVQIADIRFDRAKAVLVGPGLGRDAQAVARLSEAIAQPAPCVIDADGLALLAKERPALPERSILTPHGGEFDMLFGERDDRSNKIDRTIAAASSVGAVVVHKGADTVVARARWARLRRGSIIVLAIDPRALATCSPGCAQRA